MATILLGWELGSGISHASHMLTIADALRAQGHTPVLALKDIPETHQMMHGKGIPVIPAPPLPPVRRNARGRLMATAGFGDILAGLGLDDPGRLASLVGAWDSILGLVQPDLVIADHAPLLNVAARGRIPSLFLGNGFTLPPHGMERFPKLLPNAEHMIDESLILESFNKVQGQRGAALFDYLPQILQATDSFVGTLPLLDPYRDQRPKPANGVFEGLSEATDAPSAPRVFVYFGTEIQSLHTMLEGVALSDYPADLFIRGLKERPANLTNNSKLTFHFEPPDLQHMLKCCTVALHYGGLASTASCLAMGRPQVIVETRPMERRFNAYPIIQGKLGGGLRKDFKAASLAAFLRALHEDSTWMDRASAAARELSSDLRQPVLDRVVRRCFEIIDAA
ncbi:glycosyltransferase [Magnetospira sp. QH-2]|uniref:glycosyltransferase n=1 Tax=Magnetospira sp. (strain QH-2) TaxID=1288970 RepID=UPI0003E80F39|nr:hypothetical protein [Magnetospira sp. QH-2]CCQ72693.1 putative glycosyl transferase [Magnetospira sp. QH-2]